MLYLDLKRCPFCASEAKTWKQGLIRKQFVQCMDSNCAAGLVNFTPEEWNKRPIEQYLEDKVKRSKHD